MRILLNEISPALLVFCLLLSTAASGQTPFAPPPILRGGQVVPLYPPGSPFLTAARVSEAEQNNMAKGVPERIQSIVNIHNPSIEFHPADPGINTGVAMIVIAGGGHNTLNVGTFTITNGGVFGSLMSTPILNLPQTGILGMHKIQNRPVAIGDKIEIRPMMYLALSYDHRLVDGREAVTFLVRVKESIEDPQRLLLDL